MIDIPQGRRPSWQFPDYFHAGYGIISEAWLPKEVVFSARPDGKGELIVDASRAHPDSKDSFGSFLLSGIRHLERFQNYTPMGAVLGRLGVSAWTHVNDHDANRVFARMSFLPIPEIVDRATDLNRQLPENHKMPTLELWRGGTIPVTEYLEAWRDDKFLLADGSGDSRDGAMIVSHDLSYHLATVLARDPGTRKVTSNLAAAVLALPLSAMCNFPSTPDMTARGFFTSVFDVLGSPEVLEAGDLAHISAPTLPSLYERTPKRKGSRFMLKTLVDSINAYEMSSGSVPLDFTPPTKDERAAMAMACVDHVSILGLYARATSK